LAIFAAIFAVPPIPIPNIPGGQMAPALVAAQYRSQ